MSQNEPKPTGQAIDFGVMSPEELKAYHEKLIEDAKRKEAAKSKGGKKAGLDLQECETADDGIAAPPQPREEMFYGLAGEVARQAAKGTEVNPVGRRWRSCRFWARMWAGMCFYPLPMTCIIRACLRCTLADPGAAAKEWHKN